MRDLLLIFRAVCPFASLQPALRAQNLLLVGHPQLSHRKHLGFERPPFQLAVHFDSRVVITTRAIANQVL